MNNEPVAWMCQDNVADEWEFSSMKHCHKCEPLYTHPAELTDEEKWEVFTNLARSPDLRADMIRFADSILRKAQENV